MKERRAANDGKRADRRRNDWRSAGVLGSV
jgi:hypothetical protein